MRKLLLATVAALGVSAGMADTSFAQSSDDSGQAAAPAPGTITVRLNGRVRVFGGLVADGDANRRVFYNPATGATAEPVPFAGPGNVGGFGVIGAGTAGAPAGSAAAAVAPPLATFAPAGATTVPASTLQYNKQANYTISSYTRLYPGFDGVAANGLKYGASLEIRQDNNSGAGGGVYGSISQQSRQRGQLYLRREWGYIGTDQLGTMRFGSTDGPSGLFMIGNFENFNDGGWNGDVNNLPALNLQVTWPFADVGQLYTTNKVIYLSPQFYGVDFGIAFEPSTSNVGQAASSPGCNGNDAINAFIPAAQSIAGAGCDRLASTSTGDYSRRRNTVDAGVRYRGTYGPVGLAAYVDYIGSSKVLDSTPVQRALQFDGLNVGIGGIAVTWAGLTVGGMAQGGRFNGQWNLAPKGSSDAFAWLAGASYTYGPFIIGASYYQYGSPGSSGPVSAGISPTVGQRRERGVAAGGTYSLAPGLALFLSYLWGDRKENGFDFITGQVNTIQNTNPVTGVGAGSQNNYVKTQVLTVGTSFTW